MPSKVHNNTGPSDEITTPRSLVYPRRSDGAEPQHAGWMAAVIAIGLLAVGLTLATWWTFGIAPAMRCMTALVMPLGLLWLLFLGGGVFFLRRRQTPLAAGSACLFVLLGVVGNDRVASWLMSLTEAAPNPAAVESHDPFRAVIVLGGGASLRANGIAELNEDGERIFSAAQLWHDGKAPFIVCTGSSADGIGHPSQVGRELLQSVGVPASAIIEVPGLNTTGEMHHLKELLKNPPAHWPASGRIGLITSAFHLPRAMRLARTQGLDFTPLPCAFRVNADQPFSPRDFVPGAGDLRQTERAAKEWLAWLLGR